MNRKNIYKQVMALAIPMIIQSGITNAVYLVDNLMVGSLGTESMTGVSIVGQLMFIFNLAIFGGLSGPSIYGAQYFGQGNKEGFKNIFRLKLWIGVIVSIIGITTFLIFNTSLLELYLRGESDGFDRALTISFAMDYLSVMLWGLLPFAITQAYSGSLRESGDSIMPMVAGFISVAFDIVFNYLLIYGKFGFPRLGVRGAAIATVIARFAELLVIVISTHVTIKRRPFIQGIYSTLKLTLPNMKSIFIKSLPIFLNEFLWAGGMSMLNQCYSIKGLSIVAAFNISSSINNLLNVVMISTGGAVGIIIGQMLGASEYDEAKSGSFKLMRFSALLCAIVAVMNIGLSFIFPNFFNTTDEVKHLGQMFIIINSCFYPLQGYLNSLYFTLRAGGKTVITFLFDSVYTWVVPVTVAFILCSYTSLGILVIYAIVLSLDIIKTVIGYILIKKGVWINNLVAE